MLMKSHPSSAEIWYYNGSDLIDFFFNFFNRESVDSLCRDGVETRIM